MRRLQTRIFIHFIGVLVVVGLVTSLVLASGWRNQWARSWALRLVRHGARLVGPTLNDPVRRDAMVRHLADELDVDITLRDLDGKALVIVGEVMPQLTGDDAVSARLQAGFVRRPGGWFVAAPVRDPQTGVPLATLEAAPLTRFALAGLIRPVGALLLTLIVVAIATGPLARRISRPVARLTEASRRLGNGELSYRVPVGHKRRRWRHHRHRLDELEELTRAWNEMAERVEKLVRGQRELLANVSHELRTPLARVKVALELLEGDEATRARVADVTQDLAELERLIEDVLASSRLEAGALPAHPAPLKVGELLAGLAERAGRDPATVGKEVRVGAGAAEAAEVQADAALLRRALWNLVENAAKYGAPPIILDAVRQGSRVLLTVTDQGAGVAPEDRERVFDPFYRADKARTPGSGFGLGLTLARRVAEAHGGTARLDAARPDQAPPGCKVTLELPAGPP
jgi:signal transduction histidine kinase